MKQKILLLLLLFCSLAYSQEYAKSKGKAGKASKAKPSDEVAAIADNNMKEYDRLERVARGFLEQQEFVQAADIYTQMLALNIKTGTVYRLRGTAHMLNKNNAAAVKDFNAAIEHKTTELPSVYFMRGMCKFDLNDTAGACADIKKAKSLGAEVDESFFSAMCGKM